MLRNSPAWTSSRGLLFPHRPPFFCCLSIHASAAHNPPFSGVSLKLNSRPTSASSSCRRARRRRIHEDDESEESEYNQEIALLETYTQSKKDEILLVRAAVDGEEVEVVIFKGFSSCLSSETSTDPARSVVPATAVIRSVDRVKGPFDPSNVEYIEKGLSFDEIKSRLQNSTSIKE